MRRISLMQWMILLLVLSSNTSPVNGQSVALISPVDKETCVPTVPTLQWQAFSSADHYHVFVSKNNDLSGALYVHNNLHATSITLPSDIEIGQGETIYWKVEAYWDQGFEIKLASSNRWSFTTIKPAVAKALVKSPESGEKWVALKPTFMWDSVSGAVEYSLLISKTYEDNWILPDKLINPVTVKGISKSPFTLQSITLEESTKYYYQIGAVNECSRTTLSTIKSFTTNTKPRIHNIVQEPQYPDVGQALVVKVAVIDDGNLKKVTLKFRNGGMNSFIVLDQNPISSNEYVFEINGTYLT